MPASKTVSTCAPETEQGTHVFHILGYSRRRDIGVGNYIKSGKFSIGGRRWILVIVPDGGNNGEYPDCVSVAVVLCGSRATKASFELRLVNRSTGLPCLVYKKASMVFGTDNRSRGIRCPIRRSILESSTYLQDDRLTIECSVTVMKEPVVTESKSLFPKIDVPPSDMADHFGMLLQTKEGADVTFRVGFEIFTAHRLVLATRSPVFKAELYGHTREAGTEPIAIEDMQPNVFRALLHFIYTDSLPPWDDFEADDDHDELVRHLLVAADQYAMERMKLMCQSILCENLNVQNLATTVALADQHHCDMLKDACVEFITLSNVFDSVVAIQDYKDLKRSCPSFVIDALEKTCRFGKA